MRKIPLKTRRMALNSLDIKIIACLMRQGRMTWAELASQVDLSAPGAADRVRRLEERQVIRGYAALIDPAAIECELTAFIAVTLAQTDQRDAFLEQVRSRDEIQECHHITGEDDYWLKVRCHNTKALEHLISHHLKCFPGLKTRTTIALSTVKETPILPTRS